MIEKEIKLLQGNLFPVSQIEFEDDHHRFSLGSALPEDVDVYYTVIKPKFAEDVRKVISVETKTSEQLKELLETLVSGGFDKKKIKPRFHPYSGQQVDASSLPTMYYADEEVVDFKFPPVGFDYFSTKYGASTAYNTVDGYVIRDKPSSIVNYCVPFNQCAEESIVFHARTKSHQLWFRWSVEYIEWLEFPEDVGYYIKGEDSKWLNLSTIGTEKKNTIPLNYVYLPDNVQQDMLFNVDGVNCIVPAYTRVNLVARAGALYDKSGSYYGDCDPEIKGTWLCEYSSFPYDDDDNSRIIIPVVRKYGPPDTAQQIKAIVRNTWTTTALRKAYPEIPSLPSIVRFGNAIIREKWINTLCRRSFQLLRNDTLLSVTAKALIFREIERSSRYDAGLLTDELVVNGIVCKNVVYPPYNRSRGLLIIMRLGEDFFTNTRVGDKRVYVDKNRYGIDVGWWYNVTPL